MSSLAAAKLGAAAVLLLSALLLGLLPFLLVRRLRQDSGGRPRLQLALSCVQCFGGGVLLATVFAHMLPELHETLSARGPKNFPLAEVLVCVGMFAIYAVEELVELGMHAGDDGWMVGLGLADKRPAYGTVEPQAPWSGDDHHGHDHGHSHSLPTDGLRGFRVLVVAVALSAHSVFEGLAIGLEVHTDSVWLLTAAIAGHKAIIAFCLGQQLAASAHRTKRALVFLVVFITAAPTGVLLGLMVTTSGTVNSTDTILPQVLQALATGSILYIVVFEIIQGERAKPGSGLLKLLAVVVGFAFMVAMTQLMKDDEKPVVTEKLVIEGKAPVIPTSAVATRQ